MAQQTLRDEWIGWDSDVFIKKLIEQPSAKWCRWVHRSIERLLKSIYQKDFQAQRFSSAVSQGNQRMTRSPACSKKQRELQRLTAFSLVPRITRATRTVTERARPIGGDRR